MSSNSKRHQISDKQLIQEFKNSIYFLGHYFNQIIESRILAFGIPMSVELRRLYSTKKGDNLLRRIEIKQDLSLKFRVSDRPPDKYKLVGIDEYVNDNIFFANGRNYTRIEIISLIANQRGAHTDDRPDVFHSISAGILLPWGNPAKTKLFLTQDLYGLVDTAYQTLTVVKEQIKL